MRRNQLNLVEHRLHELVHGWIALVLSRIVQNVSKVSVGRRGKEPRRHSRSPFPPLPLVMREPFRDAQTDLVRRVCLLGASFDARLNRLELGVEPCVVISLLPQDSRTIRAWRAQRPGLIVVGNELKARDTQPDELSNGAIRCREDANGAGGSREKRWRPRARVDPDDPPAPTTNDFNIADQVGIDQAPELRKLDGLFHGVTEGGPKHER